MPPVVISVSAPSAIACAATSRSFLTLFPPNPNGIASSRLTRMPRPRRSSTGVGASGMGSAGRDRSRRIASESTGKLVYEVGLPMSVLAEALRGNTPVIAAELRPPRAELETGASMDAWIDTYHAVRGLTRDGTFVFLTDGAVGMKEEDNLRHLVINLGSDVPRSRVVPFLTCKHTAECCLAYADRAHQHGFDSLVVLGGDKHVGPARCVEHAWQLREMIRGREDGLSLGGWANPHGTAAVQVGHLLDDRVTAEFYLTQIVSHHSRPAVEAFLAEAGRRGLSLPGMFGVFYYRSAKTSTLK